MNILNFIYDWIISSKYKGKQKKIVSYFTRHKFPIIRTLLHEHQKPHKNYGHLHFYGTTRYEWPRRLDKTCPLRLYMKLALTKNKHE